MSRRNLILVGTAIGVAVLILAVCTNPNQAAHVKAIKETVELRKKDRASAVLDMVLPGLKYNNYLVFSTSSFGNKNLTYGYFGRTKTTKAMEVFYHAPG